jgi:GNAT superfamily N-acetyltransferase
MAPTEAEADLAPFVEMRETDVSAGFALSEEAGWNQTAEDWSLLIRLGRAFGIPGSEGRLVATGLALPYPSAFGWIGMVIVHGPYRRRGLATRLMERSIAELRDRGLVPFLDATPAGRPVYERMGFRAVEALTRWRGQGGGPELHDTPPLVDVAEIAELDRAAFGADRSAVLADLLARKGAVSRRDPGGDGFLLARTGRTARYVGPVVARKTGTALRLLESALAGISGPVLVDVPDRQVEITGLLARSGFEPERPFTRMALDQDTGFGDPALVRAIGAPELG